MKYAAIALTLLALTGCVYSPVQIDVYSSTTATVSGSTLSLDAHKDTYHAPR